MSLGVSPAQIATFGPLTVANLTKSFAVSRAIASFNYASLTVIFWDLFLTVPAEVSILWGSKLSFLKVVFLVNRYVAPLFLGVNIYLLSGLYKGLNDAICRGWFSISAVIQILCLASISFLIAFRLWAWYETSTRTLYILLSVWATSLLVSLGLVIDIAGIHNQDLIHEPLLNICVTVAPIVWHQWLPSTLEHGFYAAFLMLNAMATPRSKRQAALAILYRDGILFYIMTFFTALTSLLIWGFAPRLYMGFGLYPPWMIFQVGITRLLLNVKSSQMFAAGVRTGTMRQQTPLPGATAMRELPSPQGRASKRTSYVVVTPEDHMMQSTGEDEETGSATGGKSRDHDHHHDGMEHEDDHENGDSRKTQAGREIRRIQSEAGSFRRRFWWMCRKSQFADIHIDVVRVESEGGWEDTGTTGGVKESRLGRLDHWL